MPILDPIAIDALLPQTQCAQCGYAGCMPYAEAIARGAAGINQCPPGGDEGIRALAALADRPYAALNPVHGAHQPRVLAVIDEARCIGCTICIQKCPVDAIAGAAKVMHTVIASECTGCELCVVPCPVDCIALIPMPRSHPAMIHSRAAADSARARYQARLSRLARQARLAHEELARKKNLRRPGAAAPAPSAAPAIGSPEHKQSAIAAAQARAQARRERAGSP